MSKYNAKGIVGIALGELPLERQPPESWYSPSDERMPLLRLNCGNGEEHFFALTKSAVDNLVRALNDLQELEVQTPRSIHIRP